MIKLKESRVTIDKESYVKSVSLFMVLTLISLFSINKTFWVIGILSDMCFYGALLVVIRFTRPFLSEKFNINYAGAYAIHIASYIWAFYCIFDINISLLMLNIQMRDIMTIIMIILDIPIIRECNVLIHEVFENEYDCSFRYKVKCAIQLVLYGILFTASICAGQEFIEAILMAIMIVMALHTLTKNKGE